MPLTNGRTDRTVNHIKLPHYLPACLIACFGTQLTNSLLTGSLDRSYLLLRLSDVSKDFLEVLMKITDTHYLWRTLDFYYDILINK